jgi:hypothetical protein
MRIRQSPSDPGQLLLTVAFCVAGGSLAIGALAAVGIHQRSLLVALSLVVGVAIACTAAAELVSANLGGRAGPPALPTGRPDTHPWPGWSASTAPSGRAPADELRSAAPAPRPPVRHPAARPGMDFWTRPQVPPAPERAEPVPQVVRKRLGTVDLVPVAAGRSVGDGDEHQIVQCPHCGDFYIEIDRAPAHLEFRCTHCGHAWTWAPGVPWPRTVVRPRAAARPVSR